MEIKSESIYKRIVEHPAFILILIVVTIFAFFDPIRNAFVNDDLGTITFFSAILIFVVLLAAIYQARSRGRRIQPLKKEEFKPFEQLNEDTAWPRREDREQLLSRLISAEGKPIILVGESGMGKSVLVQTQIIPRLKGWKIIRFNNYTSFQIQIENDLCKQCQNIRIDDKGNIDGLQHEAANLLLVFDQFEQFLSSHPTNTDQDNSLRDWINNFLKSLISFKKVRVLIIVRKEWYYDLRFLKKFIPPPYDSYHLSGLRVDDRKDSIPTLDGKLAKVMNNEEAPDVVLRSLEVDGEISPVEAQIVGCMLENKIGRRRITGEDYNKKLGGKDSLINEFFDTTLRAAPQREIALEILFALSIETRFRRQLELEHILGIIHKPENKVVDGINYLVQQGLIEEVSPGNYQLRHDYLAEKFHDISGSQLDPRHRDNILFFGDRIRKNPRMKFVIPETRKKLFTVVSDWFMAFLVILVTARLTGPMYGVRWDWFNNLASFHTTYLGLDTYYIPVFVSHLAWSYYVTIYYRRIFSLLAKREKWFGRLLSFMTLLTCTASVVLATFIPCFWIFSIGFGGFWIGLKNLQLSSTRGLSIVSKEDFRVAGRETIVNVTFVILLGGWFGLDIQNQQPSVELANKYILVSIPTMAILTYAMFVVARLHVSTKVSSVWLGMFDRRPLKVSEIRSQISTTVEKD